jgi:hypothetical protein
MLAPILSRKAEMMDAVARTKALQQQSAPPTVIEQMMAKNAQAEQPQALQSALAPQQMPQSLEEAGVGQLPVPTRQYAGGGIIAFKRGDLVDIDEDDDEEDLIAEYAAAMQAGEMAMMRQQQEHPNQEHKNAGVGLRYTEPMPSGGSRGMVSDGDQARKHNVGNLRPSGFSYEGQVGTSKGGFAMFDSPESGLKALHHDIGIKLNRGLDTPHKFISVYAPAGDKNDVGAYSNNVAKMLGIGPNDRIPNTPEAKQLLAQAIIRQEGAHKATVAFDGGGEVKHFDGGGINWFGRGNPDKERSAFQEDVYDFNERSKEKNKLPSWMQDIGNYFTKPRAGKTSYIPNEDPNLDNRDVGMKGSIKPPISQSNNPTDQDFKDFDQAAALFQAEQKANAPTQPQTPKESYWDKLATQIESDREANKKQREEDKNMALLAAGLGIFGGSSQHWSENVGKGALSGVQYMSEANKQRAAEKAALDKNALVAQRYKELGETAKGNQAGLMAIRQGELAVHQGTLANNQQKLLEGSLDRMESAARATASAWIKANPMAGFSLENAADIEHVKNQLLAKNKRYNTNYQELYQSPFEYDTGASLGGNTLAQSAAAEKARREKEKK